MRAIYIAPAIICLACSFFSTNLGLDWLEEGFGLNPLLAFPFAVILAACGGVNLWLAFVTRSEESEIVASYVLPKGMYR